MKDTLPVVFVVDDEPSVYAALKGLTQGTVRYGTTRIIIFSREFGKNRTNQGQRERKISANSQNRQFLATPLPQSAAPKHRSTPYCRGQNSKRKSASIEKNALLRFIAASLPLPQLDAQRQYLHVCHTSGVAVL